MLIEGDSNRGFRFILALILSLIVTVTVAFNSDFLNFLDSTLTVIVQGKQNGLKDIFYTIISSIASPKMDLLWMFIIAFLMWGFKYKIPALWVIFTVLGGDVIGQILKHLMQRPRPIMHLASDNGYSYPSGHVMGSFMVLAIIWILIIPMLKKHSTQVILRTLCVIVGILVAFSRIYLNAHFPSDTIGAALIAYAWIQVSEWLYIQFAPRLTKYRFVKNTKI